VLFCSNPRGNDAEGWNGDRYGAYHTYESWKAILTTVGFDEVEHYYRPAGKPRAEQPWLASVWRRPASTGEPIFHVVRREELVWDADGRYHARSLASEGFVHASYRAKVVESAKLYFPADADLVVLEIDPTKLEARIEIADTPRGPMPHIFGPIPRAAVTEKTLADLETSPAR
jgi:uncharacterized protein (DUF952 family)